MKEGHVRALGASLTAFQALLICIKARLAAGTLGRAQISIEAALGAVATESCPRDVGEGAFRAKLLGAIDALEPSGAGDALIQQLVFV